MKVNKKDIMIFFKERKKELERRKQIAIEKEKTDRTMIFNYQIMEINYRLMECDYIEEIISLTWDIIHQKKEKNDLL